MNLIFLEIETSVKSKLNQLFCALEQRRCCKEPVLGFEDEFIEEKDQIVSTQSLQTQKDQLIDWQDHLETMQCSPSFGFNSTRYDFYLKKSYLLALLVTERGFEPIVIKKANQFIPFRFRDVQLLHILNSFGGATSPTSFLKADKTSETKSYFPYEWFGDPGKAQQHSTSSLRKFLYQTAQQMSPGRRLSRRPKFIRWGLDIQKSFIKTET